jgi:superoxide dismutase, Fe-Mn family
MVSDPEALCAAVCTRRGALATLVGGGLALACTRGGHPILASPETEIHPALVPTGDRVMTHPIALTASHTLLPLPFAPAGLNGLSERMIASHHENNYGGAVRSLNRVEQELSQITTETPPLLVAALRERELTFRNSKALHEAYFANLGGNGKRSGPIESAIAEAYGTTARWEQHMRATAMGLGGGSGWAILAIELDTGGMRTVWSGHHTQSLATSVPLLVMDLYEHSYQMDFGAGVAKYIDAFFNNVNWDEVNRRLELATRLSALYRGAGK